MNQQYGRIPFVSRPLSEFQSHHNAQCFHFFRLKPVALAVRFLPVVLRREQPIKATEGTQMASEV